MSKLGKHEELMTRDYQAAGGAIVRFWHQPHESNHGAGLSHLGDVPCDSAVQEFHSLLFDSVANLEKAEPAVEFEATGSTR